MTLEFQLQLQLEKIKLENFLQDSGKGFPQSQLDRLQSINNLLDNAVSVSSSSVNPTDLNNLLVNPSSNEVEISLLKAIALANRQLSINTQVWGSGTLFDNNGGFDKSFTVPTNLTYHILFGSATVITDSTVGDRVLKLEIINTDNTSIFQLFCPVVQQSATTYYYSLSNINPVSIPAQNFIGLEIPVSLILYGGQKIRAVLIGGLNSDKVILSLQIGTR